MPSATHLPVMSRNFNFDLSHKELAAVDEKIRSIIFNDREAGVDWSVTARKVAHEVAAVRISTRELRYRSTFGGTPIETLEEISAELEELICNRIMNPAGRKSDFDPDCILDGASTIGWVAMFMRSAATYKIMRHGKVRARCVPSEINDGDAMFGRSDFNGPRPEDDRAAEAEQMIALMGHGLSGQERKSAVVLGLGWFLNLPYAWPQVSSVRSWVEANVDGPRSALRALDEVKAARVAGAQHPLSAMFDGWSAKQIADLEVAHPMMAFAWVTGTASSRPGPTRRLEDGLAATMIPASASSEWRSVVREFISALCDAMSGADRAFGAKTLRPLSDEELSQANDRLWAAVARVTGFEGAPLGGDSGALVSQTISALVAAEYSLAMAGEQRRMKSALKSA